MIRFRISIRVVVVLCILCASELRSQSGSDAITEADRLFGYGADHANERKALDLLERALNISPYSYPLLWRTARALYYTGDGVDAKQRLAYYERGIDIGTRAVDAVPDGVEGHFWLAANYGGYCREKGGLPAFRTVKKVRAGMETVLRLNDGYEDGSAYTALGEIDRQLPGLFGGNLKRSISYLEQGLKIAPNNPEMKTALAESYLEANRKVDARRQLEELLQLPLTSTRANENRRALDRARKLLNKLDKK
jgi:tetratricopeptide (TPR) repeat protein